MRLAVRADAFLRIGACCLALALGLAACARGNAMPQPTPPAAAVAALPLGAFEDDYGIRYVITEQAWTQLPDARYEVARWHPEGRYLIARNAATNRSDPGQWTRIDWMPLPGVAPYEWAFCMSAYAAPSAEAAERAEVAQRDRPRTGCNGFPFSRMRPARAGAAP